jgi:Holliday junction resolvase RuvA-like protein
MLTTNRSLVWHERARDADGASEWVAAHEALSRLARQRAAADFEEGCWLLRALRSATHVHMGFGSFNEYVERLFGYKPRSTQEKLRVAEALQGLPVLARALESGAVTWSALRELTRVAVPQTEAAWLELARGKTVRQLEELVADQSPGADPFTAPSPSVRRHVLRFEVTPETIAVFRDAIAELCRQAGARLDDDSALLSMARQVLGGPEDPGRASYQIALSVCAACDSKSQHADGELVRVDPEILAMAECDGQHLGALTTPANQNAARTGIHDCQTVSSLHIVPQARDVRQSAHVGATSDADGGNAHPHASVPLHIPDDSIDPHVGAIHDGQPDADAKPTPSASQDNQPTPAPARAKQTIPPSLRRAVLHRDHARCRAPGCKNTRFLDLHHIQLRCEGGQHQLENLICLCGVHHRAAHRGQLRIDGTATTPSFRHADGTEYGRADCPRSQDTLAKVFSGLRRLGFREREVRAALAELTKRADLREATAESLLREALQKLAPPRVTPIRG